MTKRKQRPRSTLTVGASGDERTIRIFEDVVALTKRMAGHIARLLIDGELNLPQSERLLLITRANGDLQRLFVDEIARLRGETTEGKATEL